MRKTAYLVGALYCLLEPATAQTVAATHGAVSEQPSSCVNVTVNDHPALSYECLNQRLASSSQVPPGPALEIDPVTREPSNRQVGQFNFSAFSHRMGNSLGKSVIPQRPPPVPPPPLLGVPVGTH